MFGSILTRAVRFSWAAMPFALAGAGLLAPSTSAHVTTPHTATTHPSAAHATPAVKGDSSIVLPGATSAEGIARGEGATFYAGDAFAGDIYHGDVRRGTAALFIDAPAGRQALGMKADVRHHLLFVAGGFTGHGYVYDTRTGTDVADYPFGAAGASIINDVALVPGGAWFTDSAQPKLYFVPLDRHGHPGLFTTLTVTGPAAALIGEFNLNGIAAPGSGRTLIVAHTGNGALYTVDPSTGASVAIAGIDVPNVDGIVLRGHRVWAVQNFSNQITRFKLSADLSSGTADKVITSSLFEIPTTAALFGQTLAVVNAKFDTGVPPTASTYEVVVTTA
jgi:sugar lactone lactonase YvrE